MSNLEILTYLGVFGVSFIAGAVNMAYGDPLGLKRLYRHLGLMK